MASSARKLLILAVAMVVVFLESGSAHSTSVHDVVRKPLISEVSCTTGPLGMESRAIPDAQITASSIYSTTYRAYHARLNYGSSNNGWIPRPPSQDQWIQVDLSGLTVITGVRVQGHPSHYMTAFSVQYSDTGHSDDWQSIQDEDGEPTRFSGNTGTNVPVNVTFPFTLLTRFLRLLPLSWSHTSYRVKFEIIGCNGTLVRLVQGDGQVSGRVEILHDGVWSAVCDNDWDFKDATIVCRQLGFIEAEEAKKGSYFGASNLTIAMNRVACKGSEQLLSQCPFVCPRGGKSPCNNTQEAGVVCKPNTIRLVGGSNRTSGRVEIYSDDSWGTICDNDWDMTDAAVACRQLGFAGAEEAKKAAFFGQGEGPVYMDGLTCSGSERNIVDCPSLCWESPKCNHTQDVGVVCRNEMKTDIGTTFND